MPRRCKHKPCQVELPPASKCVEFIEKRGFCSYSCLAEHGKDKRVEKERKKARQEAKEHREATKPLSKLAQEAQTAVNRYVLVRDAGKPCISCGCATDSHSLKGGKYDAGHYRSVGSAKHLRYYTLNIARQCHTCNRYLSGNVVEYRKGLIAKLGLAKVEEIEYKNDIRRFDKEYLERIKRIFNAKTRLYKRKFRG